MQRIQAASTTDRSSGPSELALDRAFLLIAYAMNRHLVDHFMRSARKLDCDFESLMILAILAHQNVAHMIVPGSLPSVLLREDGSTPTSSTRFRPMRLRDLNQITRMPRETVRRKLERLRERGWIFHTEGGWILNAAHVDDEVREFTKENVKRFLATARYMSAMLRDAEEAPGAP